MPAPGLRRLLAEVAPDAAGAAARIELASSAVVALAVPPGTDLGTRSGVLIGSGERRPDGTPWTIKAVTVSSVKWPHLATDDGARAAGLDRALRRHRPRCNRDDDELVAAVRADLAALLGLDAEPARDGRRALGRGPAAVRGGHGDRVRGDRAGGGRGAGLAVAGAALHGVGVPACLGTGNAAAAAHLRSRDERAAPSLG